MNKYLLCYRVEHTRVVIDGHAFADWGKITQDALEVAEAEIMAQVAKRCRDLKIVSLTWTSVTRLDG